MLLVILGLEEVTLLSSCPSTYSKSSSNHCSAVPFKLKVGRKIVTSAALGDKDLGVSWFCSPKTARCALVLSTEKKTDSCY